MFISESYLSAEKNSIEKVVEDMQQQKSSVIKKTGGSFLIFTLLCSLLCVILNGCHSLTNRTSHIDVPIIDPVVLLDSSQENYADLFAGAAALTFYKSQGFTPVWWRNKTKTVEADSMIQLIRSARVFGLLPQDYHVEEIETLLDSTNTYNENFRIRKLDLLLTNAFLSMATHLKKGRIDFSTFERTFYEDDGSQIAALYKALNGKGVKKTLALQQPKHNQYHQLRLALEDIVQHADSIERDLLLKGTTIDSLSTSSKVAAIEINLERWRRQTEMSNRYILVNIPAFRLSIMENEEQVFESRIIVGTPKTQTPTLDATIKSYTLYPYWQVPRNIAVKEILPHIKKDSNYLKAHRYEVLDINGNVLDPVSMNWTKFHNDNFPVIIRQRQGVDNSLGIVKFSFINPFGVYLHDTNARKLFNRDKRALSHGCVRVEKAKELAYFLVRDDSVYYSPEDLDQYFELKKRLDIKVPNPIPLHIRYFTCEYYKNEIQFYNDVYGLDKPLYHALYKKPAMAKDAIFP